jgi:uncharacterized repeat protein (TIGR01451 family)
MWLVMIMLALFLANAAFSQEITDLSLGEPAYDSLSFQGEIHYYRIPIQAEEKIFALLDKESRYYTYLSLKEGALPDRGSIDITDQGKELQGQADGYCYVRVELGQNLSAGQNAVSFTITAHNEETFPRLTLGELLSNQELKWNGDAWWYQVPIQAGEKIFALLDKESRYYTYLSLKEGALPDRSSIDITDQGQELLGQADGYCYVRVELGQTLSAGQNSVGFTITVHDEETFPKLTLGESLSNQELKWNGDKHWYRLEINSETPLMLEILKDSNWPSTLSIKKDALPLQQPYFSETGNNNQELAFLEVTTGNYYIEFKGESNNPVSYSLVTGTDISNAKQVRFENDIVMAKFSMDRGCITGLIFKPGTNCELISNSWDRYLLDFGSQDVILRQYLNKGWQVENIEITANFIRLDFAHPSGFYNQLVLIWESDHVEVRCDITAPEEVEIDNNILPGSGYNSVTDRWAVKGNAEIQTGSFSYPGLHTWIYPSLNQVQWAKPAEGWLAFWSEGTDEVHGFTFSGGYELQVANGAATDFHFMVPAGKSRIAFHVVKPKPTTAYEAIRNFNNDPYLFLSKAVDKQFIQGENELTYTIAIGNTGKSEASGVTLEDGLPVNLDLISGSITHAGSYDQNEKKITWNIGPLDQSATDTVVFKARANKDIPNGTLIENKAQIWAKEQPVATVASALTNVAAPVVTGISPTKGGDGGMVTITLTGSNLDPGADVRLVKADDINSVIVADAVSGSPDGTQLKATFDLVGKSVGMWDVGLQNPGGGSVLLPDAFMINTGGEAKIWVEIIGRDKIRIGRQQTYIIQYGNSGNIDALGVPLWIAGIPKGSVVSLNFKVLPPIALPSTPIDYSEVPTNFELDDEIIIPLLLPKVQAGSINILEIAISIPNSVSFNLHVWTNPPWFNTSKNNVKNDSGFENIKSINADPSTADNIIDCIIYIIQKAFDSEIPYKDCINNVLGDIRKILIDDSENLPINLTWTIADLFFSCGGQSACIMCGGSGILLTPARVICASGIIYDTFRKIYGAYQNGQACFKVGTAIGESILEIESIASIDPNDKAGPAGGDSKNSPSGQQQNFINSNEPMTYMVYFENLETATAATQEILITDQLDTAFDWATFSLGSLQIGNKTLSIPEGQQNFKTTIDLRPDLPTLVDLDCRYDAATGYAEWTLKGKNPYTGDYGDILPPNSKDIAPLGQGWISYSIRPKEGLSTGFAIKNKATIDFEIGIPPAPMETPEVINTIDNDPPDSWIKNIKPTLNPSEFQVEWSGQDIGSGIRDVNIFYSLKGGEFQQLAGNVTDTVTTVHLAESGEYRFYTIAYDYAGNMEIKADTFETNIVITNLDLLKGNPQGKSASFITAYPNPFSFYTTLRFRVNEPAQISVVVYDMLGHKIRTIADHFFDVGEYSETWDGCDEMEIQVESGMYLIRFETDSNIEYSKIMLVK